MTNLSNTATPKYYGQFRDAVIRGDIPVCKEIALEMKRIDALIENPGVYYYPDLTEAWIAYCESEMTLTDGSPLKLLDSFKLWAEQIFGWYYYVQRSVPTTGPDGVLRYEQRTLLKRLTTKQYLIVARGAAKSIYDACIQSFFLNMDPTTTDQIVTAPTIRQSDETLSPIRTAITRSPGPLFKFLTDGSLQNTTGDRANRQKLASTKMGIQNFINGSIIESRPMSVDKLQGLRCKIATIDEWLSGDIREDVIGAIEQGASKLDGYLILATSSEGTVRNNIGDTIKMELNDILNGKYYNPHVSIWYYKLDDQKEVGNPAMWVKANPNLGKTVTYETYQLDVERMEQAPATKNDILAKRFGIPCEGYTYFFTYKETLCHRQRDYWNMSCAMGVDLSRGDDFCAFTFLFPLADGTFGVKTRCYITANTFANLPLATRQKYEEFMAEGSLVVLNDTILDMMDVYDELQAYIDNSRYTVETVGYDPYYAKDFIERWSQDNGPFGIVKVPQGARTESVPLGELKKLAEDRALLFDQKMIMYTMGNCVVDTDTNGNRKLFKKRREEKIDSVAAMMDALVAYKMNRDAFA